MVLRVPVIARNIEGNSSIIRDGETGMLFNDAQEFVDKATVLLTDQSKRTNIIDAARTYVRLHHDPAREAAAYCRLFQPDTPHPRPPFSETVPASAKL
jgi:glycosyltransferase involved in cell wall biosynthesis